MNDLKSMTGAEISIHGRVQGVWYRDFTRRWAQRLDLRGWVKNMPDGSVHCVVEGDRTAIEDLLKELKIGPPLARVDRIQVNWVPYTGQFDTFEIRY
jgi:acylphosphatase